jgi:hypothetical protein
MSESDPGTDRAGRRAKRFLSVTQNYEIWLQLVRQEVTIAEAATEHQVDRSTVMRIRRRAHSRFRRWAQAGGGVRGDDTPAGVPWSGPTGGGCHNEPSVERGCRVGAVSAAGVAVRVVAAEQDPEVGHGREPGRPGEQ